MTELELRDEMITHFLELFSCPPEYFCMASGRVNIIGEHIDYNGFPVIPIALNKRIYIAGCKINEKMLFIRNMCNDFRPCDISLKDAYEIREKHEWFSYILCAIKGITEHYNTKLEYGFKFLVYGDVPIAGGLSSSSALVVCSTIAVYVSNFDHTKSKLSRDVRETLANISTSSERYIGTEGGGMDQTVSLLGQRNNAILIEFDPICTSLVKLLDNYVFILSNSMVMCKKAETATLKFNARVFECRLGCLLMSHYLNIIDANILNMKMKIIFNKILGIDNHLHSKDVVRNIDTLKYMIKLIDEHFHQEPYTLDEISSILKISCEELLVRSCSKLSRDQIPHQLFIHQRLEHVISEALRVYNFYLISSSNIDEDEKAIKYGILMNESHISCQYNYDCSHKSLDQLRDICIKANALGSRLTGAGWGGYIISLVHKTQADQFVQSITENFYQSLQGLKSDYDKHITMVEASDGSDVFFL